MQTQISYDQYDNSSGLIHGRRQVSVLRFPSMEGFPITVNLGAYKSYVLNKKIIDCIRKVTTIIWAEEPEIINLTQQLMLRSKSNKKIKATVASSILYIARKYKKPLFLNTIIKQLNVKRKNIMSKIVEIEQLLQTKFPRINDHNKYFEQVFSKVHILEDGNYFPEHCNIGIKKISEYTKKQDISLEQIKIKCQYMLNSQHLKNTFVDLNLKYYVPAIVALVIKMCGYSVSLKCISSSVGISVSTMSKIIKLIRKQLDHTAEDIC